MTEDEGPRIAPRGEDARPRESRAARLVLCGETAGRIARTVEDAYPREGCGLLLGRVEGGVRVAEEVRPAANRWEGRDDRYLVDPETLRRAVDEEADGGPRVLGFYHSHPDADPVPSATDRELAWPWYLYLIVPVRDGRARRGRAWELEDGRWAERPVTGRASGPDGDDAAAGAETGGPNAERPEA